MAPTGQEQRASPSPASVSGHDSICFSSPLHYFTWYLHYTEIYILFCPSNLIYEKRNMQLSSTSPTPPSHAAAGWRKQRQWASSRAKRGARNSNTEIDSHHPHKKPRFHPTNPQFELRQVRRALFKKPPSRYHAPPFQMGTTWRYELLTFLICHSEKAFFFLWHSPQPVTLEPGLEEKDASIYIIQQKTK